MVEFTGTPRRRTPKKKGKDNGSGDSTPRRRAPIDPSRLNRGSNATNRQSPTVANSNDFQIPNKGPLTQKQKQFVKAFVHLPQNDNSQYIAFLLAGFTGSKEDCETLFNNERIQKTIKNLMVSEYIIKDDASKGANPKLKESCVRIVETAIAKGMIVENACLLGQITTKTYYEWIAKGKAAISDGNYDNNYVRFYTRITRARPQGELLLLETIHNAAEGKGIAESKTETQSGAGIPIEKRITVTKRQWQAAAWILERTRREHYGKDFKPEKDENKSAAEEAQKVYDHLDMLINNIEPVDKSS